MPPGARVRSSPEPGFERQLRTSLRPLPWLVLGLSALGCGGGSGAGPGEGGALPPADAGGDDGAGDGRGPPPVDAPGERAPARPCARNQDCPERHFCGLGSGTCVSAVVQVVAGAHHSCARHESGAVTCWGQAESILAGGATVLPPLEIPGARGARLLAAGLHQSCALTAGEQVTCWGNRSLPLLAQEDGTPLGKVFALALGAGVGCALVPEGVRCWGKNAAGELARAMELEESGAAVLSHAGRQSSLGVGI